jgi:hypothetical protein
MFDDLRERAATGAAEYEEIEKSKSSFALADILATFTPQQRFVLALMLFLNVTVIGCMCLLASGRIQF